MSNDVTPSQGPVPIEKILAFEDELRKLPPVELTPQHFFSDGVYARALPLPKGVTATGKIHKYRSLNVLLKGEVTVTTEQGVQRVCAPFIVVSPPGTKRAVYAHEDSVWLTVHGTEETDLEIIERTFTADSYDEFLSFAASEQMCLGGA